MKRSRFSEAQIMAILKEHRAGMSAPDLCRKHGINDATFSNWDTGDAVRPVGGLRGHDDMHQLSPALQLVVRRDKRAAATRQAPLPTPLPETLTGPGIYCRRASGVPGAGSMCQMSLATCSWISR